MPKKNGPLPVRGDSEPRDLLVLLRGMGTCSAETGMAKTSMLVLPAPSKFWIARYRTFVELKVSETINVMEEEQKPCAP